MDLSTRSKARTFAAAGSVSLIRPAPSRPRSRDRPHGPASIRRARKIAAYSSRQEMPDEDENGGLTSLKSRRLHEKNGRIAWKHRVANDRVGISIHQATRIRSV